MGEIHVLHRTGEKLYNVHSAEICAGDPCPLHNPSGHLMRDWPLHWRDDRKILERFCRHGVGHPDPDQKFVNDSGTHGCDGCCTGDYPL